MASHNIKAVLDNNMCCGCGACVNCCSTEAIRYGWDKYGFIIPKIDEQMCISCGKCLKVCPSMTHQKNRVVGAYAAMAKNEKKRLAGSSGGIFGIIAEEMLNNGGVVYGCAMDAHFQVRHIRVDCIDQLRLLTKSKYVQSFMGNVYQQIGADLRQGRKVLFAGTPCQVSAVKNFFPVSEKQLLTVDIVCHGVPSQKFFDSYLDNLSQKEGELERYEFRTKRIVDNGMNVFTSYLPKGKHKAVIFNWPEDSFTYLYMMAYIYRDSCYQCRYTSLERPGDITLCDYWGWENYHRDFPHGSTVSGVIVNSDNGKKVLDDIRGKLVVVPTDIRQMVRHNSCLESPSQKPREMQHLMDYWLANGYQKIDEAYLAQSRRIRLKCKMMRAIPQEMMNLLILLRQTIKHGWR